MHCCPLNRLAAGLLVALLSFVAASGAPVGLLSPAVAAVPSQVPATGQGGHDILLAGTNLAPLDAQGRRLHAVILDEPSLATYNGGLAGLAPTSPRATGASRLDVNAPASQAYLAFLADRQSQVLGRIQASLGRDLAVEHRYLNVLNAMTLNLTPAEARSVSSMDGIRLVLPDRIMELETDIGPGHIGAPWIWNGVTLSSNQSRGEGVVVGVLDTGINSQHPSFAEVDMDGYMHVNPYGSGNFVGWCASNPGFCNDKLIGAWTFHPNGGTPEDSNGHGSHTASTAAGNRHVAAYPVGGEVFNVELSGVAPRANVIAYKVCDPTCPQTSSVNAVNQAIADGVDVLNYSISGTDNPWLDLVDLAFLDAFDAGLFVSASAGNSGPGPGTVAKTGPWNAAVAATTHERIFANVLSLEGGPVGAPAAQGSGPSMVAQYTGDLRWSGDVNAGNVEGCSAFPAGAFDGEAALIARGTCAFSVKVNNAVAAGANFVVVYNHVGGPPVSMGGLEATAVPSVMVDNVVGGDLIAALGGGIAELTVDIEVDIFYNPDYQDVLGGFSSRGPSQFDLLAPTFAAPGVNILAAGPSAGGDPDQWYQSQGTSMSSPHAAGAGALVRGLHPDWTPAEIRSALALSARPALLLKEDGATSADPFDYGSGLIDLDASGRQALVMDETTANFNAANPAIGGDPRTLNLPSLVDQNCENGCAFERTVRNASGIDLSYEVAISAPSGMSIAVNPSTFSIDAGQSQELQFEVSFDFDLVAADQWAFASIAIEPSISSLLPSGVAISGFVGDFDLSNWTLVNDPAGVAGSFQTEPGPPVEVYVTGGNSGVGGNTDFQVTVPENGFISFDWGYQATDTGCWDSGGVAVNGVFTVLACNNEPVSYFDASYSLPVQAGDLFAFRVFTEDGAFGAGTLGVTNFGFDGGSAPASARIPVAVIPRQIDVIVPEADISPAAFEFTMAPDMTVDDELLIGNVGTGPLTWTITQAPAAVAGKGELPRAHFPSEPRTLPMQEERTDASALADPGAPARSSRPLHQRGIVPAVPAYSNAAFSRSDYVFLDALVPGVLTTVVNPGPTTIFASAFIAGNVDQQFFIATGGGNLAHGAYGYIDTATGSVNQLGVLSGAAPASGTWTSAAWDPVGDTVYATIFSDNQNQLHSIDLASGASTLVGVISGGGLPDAPIIIAIAISNSGLMYGIDIIGNAFLAIDKTDATPAVIGPTGINPNFAQDMDFDRSDNTLYWAGYQGGGNSHVYTVNLETGTATAVGPIQDGAELVNFSIAVLGGACSLPEDIPWLSVSPEAGSTDPGTTDSVTISIDSAGLPEGIYSAVLCVFTNDPSASLVEVPVELTIDVTATPPVAQVTPDSFEFSVFQNGTGSDVLSIGNTGGTTLTWTIDTAEPAGNGDIVYFDDIDFAPNQTFTGGSVQWHTGDTCDCDTSPFDLNIYETGGAMAFFWPRNSTSTAGGVTVTGTSYAVLEPGDTIGPGSSFIAGVGTSPTVNWRQADGVDGYLGFRFNNPAQGGALNYGYARLTTTGTSGYPVTVVSWAYNQAGDPITILPEACDNPASIPWLSVDPAAGSTESGETSLVDVMVDATGLPAGSYEALLCVISNDPDSGLIEVPVTLVVSEQAAGELAVMPKDLAFGEVSVGSSAQLELEVGNSAAGGAASLELSVLAAIGDDGFSISGGSCAIGTALAPGESCTIEVTFAPGLATSYIGQVELATADGQSALVPLAGTGIQDPGVLDVDVVGVDFGQVTVQTQVSSSVTVANAAAAGAASLELDTLALAGDGMFTISGGNCSVGLELAPGAACQVELSFAPTLTGAFSATLSIGTVDGQAETVNLLGEGIELPDAIFSDRFEAQVP
jgi:hypothetical protein